MIKTFETNHKKETGVLVALVDQFQTNEVVQEYLDELSFLSTTLGVETIGYFTQKMDKPDVATFVRKGKLEEIKKFVKTKNADMVIFDDDLSPSQLRNLEKALDVKIYDRSLLILDIFRLRAQTSQAKTQVELAHLQYLLPVHHVASGSRSQNAMPPAAGRSSPRAGTRMGRRRWRQSRRNTTPYRSIDSMSPTKDR